jgi:hypothetical protein
MRPRVVPPLLPRSGCGAVEGRRREVSSRGGRFHFYRTGCHRTGEEPTASSGECVEGWQNEQ